MLAARHGTTVALCPLPVGVSRIGRRTVRDCAAAAAVWRMASLYPETELGTGRASGWRMASRGRRDCAAAAAVWRMASLLWVRFGVGLRMRLRELGLGLLASRMARRLFRRDTRLTDCTASSGPVGTVDGSSAAASVTGCVAPSIVGGETVTARQRPNAGTKAGRRTGHAAADGRRCRSAGSGWPSVEAKP